MTAWTTSDATSLSKIADDIAAPVLRGVSLGWWAAAALAAICALGMLVGVIVVFEDGIGVMGNNTTV
ncbi:MAG: hypothetical protein ACRED8_06685, partial [Caulobacteraceae bacterium]